MEIEIVKLNKSKSPILPLDIVNIIFSFLKKCHFCKLKYYIFCEKFDNKFICSECFSNYIIKNLKNAGFL